MNLSIFLVSSAPAGNVVPVTGADIGQFTAVGILITVLVFFLVALSVKDKRTHRSSLGSRFKALGNMQGMSKDQIIASVGRPMAINNHDNLQLLHWVSPSYSIVIMIDENNIFAGIQSERNF
jgi:hypothetical protein